MARVTLEGETLIRRSEGWAKALPDGRARPYLCPAGKWTIGWGSCTGPDGLAVRITTPPITREQGEAMFRRDVAKAEQEVLALLRVPVADSQLSAMVSFVYNFGQPKFAASTLLRLVNAGRPREAADQFPRWVHVERGGQMVKEPGLVARRRAERAMFLRDLAVPA